MNPLQSTYRIIDAANNRVGEGLRTIEECCRFVLDHADLTSRLKHWRHEFASAMEQLPRESMLRARDSDGDVGSSLSGSNEYQRDGHAAVVIAASERVRQSLRVLEEYGKTIDTVFAKNIESLRYESYDLMRDVELAVMFKPRRDRLGEARLYALIDCKASEDEWQRNLRQLADAGVDVFQLRDKQASDRQLYQRAVSGSRLAAELGVLFIVNDRVDLALASDADGVHLGQSELPITSARSLLGDGRLIGISTHTIEQVHAAINEGADYIGCGPTFPSRTKSFSSHAGVQFLKDVHEQTRATPRPAFAIGGIDLSNVPTVLDAGFHRIAVTAAIQDATNPFEAAKALKKALMRNA
ncbi:MAG: thiamine phosphate synthase [Planctomycetota bacterium]